AQAAFGPQAQAGVSGDIDRTGNLDVLLDFGIGRIRAEDFDIVDFSRPEFGDRVQADVGEEIQVPDDGNAIVCLGLELDQFLVPVALFEELDFGGWRDFSNDGDLTFAIHDHVDCAGEPVGEIEGKLAGSGEGARLFARLRRRHRFGWGGSLNIFQT